MRTQVIVIFIILLLGFLASRIRFDEPIPQTHSPQTSSTSTTSERLNIQDQASTPSSPIASESTMFNLNGEWRGVLQPLHGANLDPRDWDLELKLFISENTAQVHIKRGEQWQEVKAGKFKITQHKTNAILHSIDSGRGWVESWVFSLSRHDKDSINVYGNRIINNFKQTASTASRISYGSTGNFKRIYKRTLNTTVPKSDPLSDDDIASQIQKAIARGTKEKNGKLTILEQRITYETNDSATLQVKYQYDGGANDNAWISAITHSDGKSTGHWSFRPVKLRKGERFAQIRVGMSSASPNKYCSDSFVIQAYVASEGNFFEKHLPYKRCWSKK